MFNVKKIVRSLAVALTVAGLAFGSFSVSGAFQDNTLIADIGGQKGDWDPG